MIREECEKALETIGDWSLWDSERTENGMWKVKDASCDEYKVIEKLINEHFDNPPLSFDGLVNMIGLPVWDDKEKMWFIVGEIFKPFAFNVPIWYDALSIKLVNYKYGDLIITNNFELHEPFEENRFYRRQKEDLR